MFFRPELGGKEYCFRFRGSYQNEMLRMRLQRVQFLKVRGLGTRRLRRHLPGIGLLAFAKGILGPS